MILPAPGSHVMALNVIGDIIQLLPGILKPTIDIAASLIIVFIIGSILSGLVDMTS